MLEEVCYGEDVAAADKDAVPALTPNLAAFQIYEPRQSHNKGHLEAKEGFLTQNWVASSKGSSAFVPPRLAYLTCKRI